MLQSQNLCAINIVTKGVAEGLLTEIQKSNLMRVINLIIGFLIFHLSGFSQITGQFQSNFAPMGLRFEYLNIDCDSSFTMDKKTEFLHDLKKRSWKLKVDTLILSYNDSLGSIEKYVIVDTVLKKVMPIWSDKIRDLFRKETGKELPMKDIRLYNLYGDEREYFLIRKGNLDCK